MNKDRLTIESQAELEKVTYNFNKRINDALTNGSYNDVMHIIFAYATYMETNMKLSKMQKD